MLRKFTTITCSKMSRGASIRLMAARLVLLTAAFSALAATVVSAIFTTVVFVVHYGGARGIAQFLETILIMCVFTSIPAGTFGFAVGLLGGALWCYRGQHIKSVARLLAEAVGFGAILSVPFPVFHKAIGLGLENEPWFDMRMALFSIAVGCTCAALIALTLRFRAASRLPATE